MFTVFWKAYYAIYNVLLNEAISWLIFLMVFHSPLYEQQSPNKQTNNHAASGHSSTSLSNIFIARKIRL